MVDIPWNNLSEKVLRKLLKSIRDHYKTNDCLNQEEFDKLLFEAKKTKT